MSYELIPEPGLEKTIKSKNQPANNRLITKEQNEDKEKKKKKRREEKLSSYRSYEEVEVRGLMIRRWESENLVGAR